MNSKDSPIYKFYPNIKDIKIETKNKYKNTDLVPFININLLKNTFNNIYNNSNLSVDEINRNKFTNTKTFINTTKLKL